MKMRANDSRKPNVIEIFYLCLLTLFSDLSLHPDN